MAVTPIELNFTTINDYNLTLDLPAKSGDWIPAIIEGANSSVGGHLTLILMTAWFIVIFWTLSDKSPFGEFKFSDPRGLNLALGYVSTLGITFIEANFFSSFRVVAMFIVFFIISYIFILIYDNKE